MEATRANANYSPEKGMQPLSDGTTHHKNQQEERRQNCRTVMAAMLFLLAMLSAPIWLGCAGDGPPPGPPPPPANPSHCSNGIVVEKPRENPGLVADCETLLRARDVLAEPGRLYWNAQISIRSWKGVLVDEESPQLRVTGLHLPTNSLHGALSSELGRLTGLLYLNLSNNGLRGEIPAELGNLTHLRRLHLTNNFR